MALMTLATFGFSTAARLLKQEAWSLILVDYKVEFHMEDEKTQIQLTGYVEVNKKIKRVELWLE